MEYLEAQTPEIDFGLAIMNSRIDFQGEGRSAQTECLVLPNMINCIFRLVGSKL